MNTPYLLEGERSDGSVGFTSPPATSIVLYRYYQLKKIYTLYRPWLFWMCSHCGDPPLRLDRNDKKAFDGALLEQFGMTLKDFTLRSQSSSRSREVPFEISVDTYHHRSESNAATTDEVGRNPVPTKALYRAVVSKRNKSNRILRQKLTRLVFGAE